MKRTLIVSLIAFTMLLGGCGNAAHEASQSVETQTTVTQESQETTESSSGSTTETESTTSSEPETASSTQTSETKESKEKDSTTSTAEKEKETKATSTATKTSKETKSTTTSQENKNTAASSSQKSDKTSDTKNSGTEQEEKTNPPSKDTSSTGNSNSPNNEPSKEPEQHVCSFDGGTVTTAATCSSAGVKTYRCSCGATKTETIAATGHQMTTENTAGSCTEAGKSKTYCKVCGYVESETTSGAATGHSYGEVTWFLPQTCESEGYWNQVCTVCGYAIGGNGDSTLPHSFDGGAKEGSPCIGYAVTYTCSMCGWQEVEELPPDGDHSWGASDIEGYKKCNACDLYEPE